MENFTFYYTFKVSFIPLSSSSWGADLQDTRYILNYLNIIYLLNIIKIIYFNFNEC